MQTKFVTKIANGCAGLIFVSIFYAFIFGAFFAKFVTPPLIAIFGSLFGTIQILKIRAYSKEQIHDKVTTFQKTFALTTGLGLAPDDVTVHKDQLLSMMKTLSAMYFPIQLVINLYALGKSAWRFALSSPASQPWYLVAALETMLLIFLLFECLTYLVLGHVDMALVVCKNLKSASVLRVLSSFNVTVASRMAASWQRVLEKETRGLLVKICLSLMYCSLFSLLTVIAFASFVEKIRALGVRGTEADWPWHLDRQVAVNCIIFLNQVLGIIDIDKLFQDRLLQFLFARGDSTLSNTEQALSERYMLQLRRSVWSMHGATLSERCVASITFGSDDLQKLALVDVEAQAETVDWEIQSNLEVPLLP